MDEQNQTSQPVVKSSSSMVPVAIVIAGVIIAGAIYFRGAPLGGSGGGQTAATDEAFSPDPLKKLRPVGKVGTEDWVRGQADAPIKIVEYSDLECPYCKRFHETMIEINEAYPNDVAWVYRHFPLEQLHKKARKEAEASECAGKIGGNDKFWAYIDKVFAATPSNDGLDHSLLPKFAEEIGLNRSAFEKCLMNGETKTAVDEDYNEALSVGGTGTPYPIVIAPDGQKIALKGAVPFEAMSEGIDAILAEKK